MVSSVDLELSLLELCLTIAISRLGDSSVFNFEMVFDEFRAFTTRVAASNQGLGRLQFTKKVALKGFEALEQHGLIKFESGIGAKCPKEYRRCHLLMTTAQLRNLLVRYDQPLPQAVKRWIKN